MLSMISSCGLTGGMFASSSALFGPCSNSAMGVSRLSPGLAGSGCVCTIVLPVRPVSERISPPAGEDGDTSSTGEFVSVCAC